MQSDEIVRDLGYQTAGQVLAAVAEPGTCFAAADRRGEFFWRSDSLPAGAVLAAFRDCLAGGEPHAGVTRRIGDRGELIVHPIADHDGEPIAWLVGWTEDTVDDAATQSWKRVSATLPRVAEGLSREYALARELAGAVSELTDRYEELNVVFRMERASRAASVNQDVVHSMLSGFLQHLKIDVGVLILTDSNTSLADRGTSRAIPNADLVITELRGKIWRFISAARKPLVMNDVADERRGYLLTNLPFKLLAIPNDGCDAPDAGLLLLRHLDEPDFTNSDMNLARVFFSQALILLRNQNLLGRMERFTRQIASSLVETVEAKDPYTRGHSERVEQITAGIGREAGVDAKDYDDLLWGALLHDIGKIGIPDAILMKPGRLDKDEYTFIKTHPTRSYEILRHIEQLGPAALDGARYHQEKFDGSGYPFGLAGKEIPLVARVISIADTYDAVTSSRSYRAASNHDDAMEIIRGAGGNQLDPELVAIFERLIEEDQDWLAAIRTDHGDGPLGPSIGAARG